MENIAKALVQLQSELKPVDKNSSNPFFKSKYADLPEVMQTIQPLLAKNKLAVVQMMSELNGEPALTTIVLHESGEKIEATSPLFLAKNDPQSHGSSVTYARRYGVMSALGIVADEDDDGNKAVQATRQPAKTAPKPVADDKPTKAQLDTIYSLASGKGMTDDEIRKAVAKVTTKDMAEASIKKLEEK